MTHHRIRLSTTYVITDYVLEPHTSSPGTINQYLFFSLSSPTDVTHFIFLFPSPFTYRLKITFGLSSHSFSCPVTSRYSLLPVPRFCSPLSLSPRRTALKPAFLCCCYDIVVYQIHNIKIFLTYWNKVRYMCLTRIAGYFQWYFRKRTWMVWMLLQGRTSMCRCAQTIIAGFCTCLRFARILP